MADEIDTTGLRVRHDPLARRRRRSRPTQSRPQLIARNRSAGGSSQEEYEESESESDKVMTSSNEALPLELPNVRGPPSTTSSDNMSAAGEEDEDENATAVGYRRSNEPVFTPQPNAFSHANELDKPSNDSYFPPARATIRTTSQRHSFSAQHQHSPHNVLAPSQYADHDAALRASLSTLLSVAAAARGTSKSSQPNTMSAPQPSRIEPSTLRVVPESVAMGTGRARARVGAINIPANPSSSRSSSADKHKRKATNIANVRSSSKDRARATKKARRASTDELNQVNPTLMTWVISAGVVVLVSALSFSAGYVVGKEAGRADALTGSFQAMGTDNRTYGELVGEAVGRSGPTGLKRRLLMDMGSATVVGRA